MNRFNHLPNSRKTQLPLRPPFWAVWMSILFVFVLGWLLPVPDEWRVRNLVLSGTALVYLFLMFRMLARYDSHSPAVLILRQIINLFFIAIAEFSFRPLGVNLDALYLLPIASAGLTSGRWGSLLVATAATAIVLARDQYLLRVATVQSPSSWILIASCYIGAVMIGELRAQMLERLQGQQREIDALQKETAQRADQMAVLLQLGPAMARSLNVEAVCQAIYTGLSGLMPCDALFAALHDEAKRQNRLIFKTNPNQPFLQRVVPFDKDLASYVIRSGERVRLDPTQGDSRFDTRVIGIASQARSLIAVPLILGDKVIGALATQSFQPQAYTEADVETAERLAAQAATALQNARYLSLARDIAGQLAALNRVAQIVTSTLELERVMDLIYGEVSRVLFADSYLLATVNLERDEMRIEFLADEGRHYPTQTMALGATLAGWVASQRAPLLLTNVPEQIPALRLQTLDIGSRKPALSWLGVPLLSGVELVGILAVASYVPDRFDKDDLDLLSSIAQQVTIAIVNARTHAQLQEQSRLDSLTQVYNHGYFISRLTGQVERARNEKRSLTLIMLDIDYFKKYNDTYGHRVGDQVLKATVHAIRAHIERTDIVGRWGGEEFGIVLLRATTAQAVKVGERIRATLRVTKMQDEEGHPIQAPTVSQGIANVPEHTNRANRLIVLADRALYVAKTRGRDRVHIAEAEN